MLSRSDHKKHIAGILAAAISESERREAIRILGKTDLFFLLTELLKRLDADNDFAFQCCLEVERNPDGHLDLWAREHYKSTIITFAKTIQDIINDPEITVGIFSFNRPIAKAFLRQIKREFESNEDLKSLYPEVLYSNPARESAKWSEDDGIIVRRKSNPKEATVEAWGLVDGQPTSKHFRLRIYDDVVTKESVSTPEQIEKVTNAWALSLNLGTSDGVARYAGTRYHYNDTYKTIIDRKEAILRLKAATVDGTFTGEPVLWTKEILAKKRQTMGAYVASAQLMNDPAIDSTQGFKAQWVQYYNPAIKFMDGNFYILVDPANEKKKTSDFTTMWVVRMHQDKNYYLIDGIHDRLNLTERTAALFKLVREYHPRMVAYEQYGMQSDIQHIKYMQDQQDFRFVITPVGGKEAKADRIKKLVPIFEQGRFYLPFQMIRQSEGKTVDLVQRFLNDEYLSFPYCFHDDMLDCLARILCPDLNAIFPDFVSGRTESKRCERVKPYNELDFYGAAA
jgi:phage terminase large subunit-like protein